MDPLTLLGAPATGTLQGRLLASEEGQEGEPSAAVVYLEPLDAPGSGDTVAAIATLRQLEDESWPSFRAVAAGDKVTFRGQDEVHHRIFSYSEPNAFELGIEGPDAADAVRLRHEGVVRFYCSLHPWESGLIFVTPSPWFDTVGPSGSYEIRDVPRGRYRLRVWSEPPRDVDQVVVVQGGKTTALDVPAPPHGGS